MQYKKKILSLSLATLLILPSAVNAVSIGDIVSTTSTSAGSWQDPLGGGTYMYGGDIKIKFKKNHYIAPLFQFKPPSMKLGCNGISLSEGFISFLGLDKIKLLISNSGSSLVFGVILGMEFTLPAISNVFNKIRAWANALQAMLQNGCNIGKALSKASKLGKSLHTNGLSDAINAPFDKLNTFISEGGDEWLKTIEDLGQCDGVPDNPKCKQLVNVLKAISDEVHVDLISNSARSVLSNALMPIITPKIGQDYTTKYFTLDNVYNDSMFNGCPTPPATQAMNDTNILIDKLKYLFFGDIAVSGENINNIKTNINNTTCKLNMDTSAKKAKKAAGSGEGEIFESTSFALISPIINAKDAVTALMHGFGKITESYTDYNSSSNSISIPNRDIIYIDLPKDIASDGNATKRIRAIYVSADKNGNISDPLTWNGLFKESLKGIQTMVKAIAPGLPSLTTSSYSEFDTSTTKDPTVSSSGSKTPLMLPSIKKYVNVVARLERKAGGETPETQKLKTYLARINAVLFAEVLMNGIESRVMMLSSGISGKSDIITSYKKSTNETIIKINKELEKIKKDLRDQDMLTPFKEIERNQAIQSLKSST